MKFASITPLAALFCAFSTSVAAQTWVDKHHQHTADTVDKVAEKVDGWIGPQDPNNPATATLRVMLDNQWNRYDGYSIKPRVRAKIKLPALKNRFSVVIGDEALDNHARNKTQIVPNYAGAEKITYDNRQARNDNASLALRWSSLKRPFGLETDFDVGLRSGGDVFGRFKAQREWTLTDHFSTRFEQIYRYGSNSKHYARSNLELKYQTVEDRFLANQLYFEYFHDVDEYSYWGNSFYQQHNFANLKRLTYGIFTGGRVYDKKPHLHTYGPFITWRQPVWKEWIFLQTELNYYNSKEKERPHHLGAFLRLEMLF